MTSADENLEILGEIDLSDLDSCAHLLAENIVWHVFNPASPDMHGDYEGLDGLRAMHEKLVAMSQGTLETHPIGGLTIGDELLFTQTVVTFERGGRLFEYDAATTWRIVDGKVAEVWDIPAVYTVRDVTDDPGDEDEDE